MLEELNWRNNLLFPVVERLLNVQYFPLTNIILEAIPIGQTTYYLTIQLNVQYPDKCLPKVLFSATLG